MRESNLSTRSKDNFSLVVCQCISKSFSEKDGVIADVVFAERIRRRVTKILKLLLESVIKDDEGKPDLEAMFWLKPTLFKALFGINDTTKAENLKEETCQEAPEPWMVDTMNEQLLKLNQLILKTPHQ